MAPSYPALLAQAEKLRVQCEAERERTKRLRKEAAKTVAAAARAVNRAQQLYEGKGRS